MQKINPGLLMLIGTLVASVTGIYVILVFDAKKRGKGKLQNIAAYSKKYQFYYDNFLTRNSFRKVVEQIAGLSIYNSIEIRINSVKFFRTTMAISIGLLAGGAFVFKDIISTVILALYAIVMRTVLINKRIDAVRFKFLQELSEAISSLIEHFTINLNIPIAFNECKRGTHVSKAFEQIYIILTANDGERKLDEFYETTPFKSLRTSASIAYKLNESGDSTTATGQSTFRNAMTLVKDETDAEIRKLTLQRIKFNMLEYLPIAPVFFVGVVQSFFMSNIPGTSIMYNGMLGYLARLLVALTSFIGYYFITTIISPNAVRVNDRLELVDNLLHVGWFKQLVKNVMPRKAKAKEQINEKIKGSLSSKDMEYIFASKILTSAAVAIFTIITLLLITEISRDFTYNNVKSLSLLGGTEYTEQENANLFKLDSEYMAMDKLPQDQVIVAAVATVLPKITDFDQLEQVDRIRKKFASYKSLKFHWWYVLVAYACGVGAWFIPELQLKLRAFLVKTEAKEDVLQLQNIIIMLMDTAVDTLDVLYWMARNSVIHKDALMYAYHEYPSDPEKALNRLKSKSTIPEFLSMCDSLISTIHQISLAEAFSSLMGQRSQIMKISEMIQKESIKSKRRIASPLAMAALIVLVLGLVIAPIAILGYQQFVNTMAQAGFGGK